MDQLPRLGKRELICLLLFTCNYVVSVWRGLLFLWVLGMGYVILLWHSLSLPLIIFQSASNDMQPYILIVVLFLRIHPTKYGKITLIVSLMVCSHMQLLTSEFQRISQNKSYKIWKDNFQNASNDMLPYATLTTALYGIAQNKSHKI